MEVGCLGSWQGLQEEGSTFQPPGQSELLLIQPENLAQPGR